MMNNKLEPMSRVLLRVSLALCAPIAVLLGARAIVHAEVPFPPAASKKLSAAEMKANLDYLKPEVHIGTPVAGPVTLNTAAGTWSQVPEITLTFTPKNDGMFKIHGNFVAHCDHIKPYELVVKLGLTWTNSATITNDLKLNAMMTASPVVNGNAESVANFAMQPSLIAPLKAGQTYVFLLRSYAQDCKKAYISGDSDAASHAVLIAERIAE